jgi:hypothetical protein
LKKYLLLVLVLYGCSSKVRLQGALKGEHVPCAKTVGADVVGCRASLEAYFKRSPEARIAGIDAVYALGVMDLLVWTTKSTRWPRASDLSVSEVPCVRAPAGPDCLSPIDSLWIGEGRDHHAFLVPLATNSERGLGSWSFLDVQTKSPSLPPPTVVDVPCRLEKGQPYLVDFNDVGVMAAQTVEMVKFTYATSSYCLPALLLFLRSNPDRFIRNVVAEDGKDGTSSLLVMMGSETDGAARARDLRISELGCPTQDCVSLFIQSHNETHPSSTLFSVPLATTFDSGTQVAFLLVASLLK